MRERQRAQTRERIRECAIQLFLQQGYEETTVAEVAAAAGVSHMTFFRNFPTKQDVLDFDVGIEALATRVRNRPRNEAPLTVVHQAMLESMTGRERADEHLLRRVAQLIMENAPLRAWLWEKHRAREQALTAALAARTPGASALQCQVVAAAGVAIAGAAFAAWVADPARDLATVLDDAFTAARLAATC
jgi:AcrR family transcriptional regulator